jgi:hypothetical protein
MSMDSTYQNILVPWADETGEGLKWKIQYKLMCLTIDRYITIACIVPPTRCLWIQHTKLFWLFGLMKPEKVQNVKYNIN